MTATRSLFSYIFAISFTCCFISSALICLAIDAYGNLSLGLPSILIASIVISFTISLPLSKIIANTLSQLMNDKDKARLFKETSSLVQNFENDLESLVERLESAKNELSLLNMMLDNMKEAVFLIDADRRVVTMNKAGQILFHIDSQWVMDLSINSLIRDMELKDLIDQVFETGKDTSKEICIWTGLDGTQKQEFFIKAVAIKNGRDRIVEGVLMVMDDITMIKRLEDMRQNTIANISHELKTPVTAIRGYCETLLDMPLTDSDTVKEFLSVIDRQSKRLERLVEGILLLSRIETKDKLSKMDIQPLNIQTILASAISSCSPLATHKQVSVELSCQDEIPAVLGDELLLEQAINNLLQNAIEFSHYDGIVLVKAHHDDNNVIIEIQDFGIGIPAKHLDRIFERFYVVDKKRARQYGGNGLGLAIVKHIVRAHRGRLEVNSTPGVGTTFTIILPLANPDL